MPPNPHGSVPSMSALPTRPSFGCADPWPSCAAETRTGPSCASIWGNPSNSNMPYRDTGFLRRIYPLVGRGRSKSRIWSTGCGYGTPSKIMTSFTAKIRRTPPPSHQNRRLPRHCPGSSSARNPKIFCFERGIRTVPTLVTLSSGL